MARSFNKAACVALVIVGVVLVYMWCSCVEHTPPFPCPVESKSYHETNNDVKMDSEKMQASEKASEKPVGDDAAIPTIFVITPTYTRHMQKVELTRQCQTFTLVKNLHWIVIEDSDTRTALVDKLLDYCPVKSTLLNRKTSKKMKQTSSDIKHKNRGAQQRNIGLEWLREQYRPGEVEGVVYFADDDNTYDIRIFEEMRYTKKVSVWPVGFVGGLKAEGPRCKNGQVLSFHVSWSPERKFPVDMAAFAVNLNIFLSNPGIELDPSGSIGRLETNLLSKILKTRKELEGKANDCREVYVWHTETKGPWLKYEPKNPTDLEV